MNTPNEVIRFFFILLLLSITTPMMVMAQKTLIKGKVVDERGLPIQGVEVTVDGTMVEATNSQGRFEVTMNGQVERINHIQASKRGYKIQEWGYQQTKKEIQILMWPSYALLTGVVLDINSSPIAGKQVVLQGVNNSDPSITDINGNFSISLFSKGPIDNTSTFILDGKVVDKSSLVYDPVDNFMTIKGIASKSVAQTDSKSTSKTETTDPLVNPVLVVVVYDQDETPAKGMDVLVDDKSFKTNELGRFETESDLVQNSDFKVTGFQVTKKTYDYKNNYMYVYISKGQDEIDVISNIDSLEYGEYDKNFNTVLNKLELEKQLLSEKGLEIRTEMERIAEKLSTEQSIKDNQRKSLETYMGRLEEALIENELAYEDAQFKTKIVLDKMKSAILEIDSVKAVTQEKLLTIQGEKEALQKEFLVSVVLAVSLLVVAILFYIGYRRIQTQKSELEIAHQNLHIAKNDLEKAYNDIQAIRNIGQRLTTNLEFDRLLTAVHVNVNAIVDASYFGVGIVNEDEGIIEFKNYIELGRVQGTRYDSIDDENKLSSWCVRNQKEIVMNDVEADIRRYVKDKPVIKDSTPRSVIYMPLMMANKCVGVLTVQSPDKNAYVDIEENILRTLSSYISVAVANTSAYEIIKIRNRKITDSIRYAQTIQQAILPSTKHMSDALKDYFLIFKPKDIVSGDFYWVTKVKDGRKEKVFVAVVDSTGHGVPGAFMSMIGNTVLNETINQKQVYNPSEVLSRMNELIRLALRQDETDNTDGMDVCLCVLEKEGERFTKLTFSGAKRPLYIVKAATDELEELKGQVKSVGGMYHTTTEFVNHEVTLQKGDMLYLATDGMPHQHNEENKKFGSLRFKTLLQRNSTLTTRQQQKNLESALEEHQSGVEQRDDITVLGIRC